MRIDPVLCQNILIAVESDPSAGSGQSLSIFVDGYDEKIVAHHVKYLWDEGLITGSEATHLQSPFPEILVFDITPDGRRLLDEREPESPRRRIGF
jgi:hypothetical protein